jgi:hypothetical protein
MKNLSIEEIAIELSMLKTTVERAKARQKALEGEILERYQERIRGDNRIHNGCGTINIEEDDYQIKVTIPKKVDWDQIVLAELHDKIEQAGEDPEEYIKVGYNVSETAFKNWPTKIQDEFMPARTMKPGMPRIQVEKVNPRKGE